MTKGSRTFRGMAIVSLLVPGWVQWTMLGKDLPCKHLIVGPTFSDRTITFVKLDRIGGPAIMLILVLIQRVMLLGYGAFAGLTLACEDGRIGRQDEGGRRLFRFFYFGG
jgi:hypothetical protein